MRIHLKDCQLIKEISIAINILFASLNYLKWSDCVICELNNERNLEMSSILNCYEIKKVFLKKKILKLI